MCTIKGQRRWVNDPLEDTQELTLEGAMVAPGLDSKLLHQGIGHVLDG
jgi:hypothetical protein